MTSQRAKKVAAVPRGFRRITLQLSVADVDAASSFYAQAFGAMEADRVCAPGTDVALFAQLKFGDSMILLNAAPDCHSGTTGNGMMVHQYLDELDQTWAAAVEAGCAVIAPIDDTYWGDRVGVLQDPFGFRWSLGKRVERVTNDERLTRLAGLQGADAEPDAAVLEVADEALWSHPGSAAEPPDSHPAN